MEPVRDAQPSNYVLLANSIAIRTGQHKGGKREPLDILKLYIGLDVGVGKI